MKTTSVIGWSAHKPEAWATMTPDEQFAWLDAHCISVKFGIGHYSRETCIKRARKAGITRGCIITYRTWRNGRVAYEKRHVVADAELAG